ncbi:MAG: hypothetical protein ACKVKT_11000, partial [Rhodospirillales bacterium]
QVLLIDAFEEGISFNETFADSTQQDRAGSVFGLWGNTSYLDSGQSQDGTHNGGSSGALGYFAPSSSSAIVFSTTDLFTFVYSDFLEEMVGVRGGFYPFSEVLLPSDNNVVASGDNPLRLVAQGDFISDSKILIGGVNAPGHVGKAYYGAIANGEYDGDESQGEILESLLGVAEFDDNEILLGGEGAIGDLGGGDGGSGGDTWLADSIGFSNNSYYNVFITSWSQFVVSGLTPGDRYRENMGINDDRYSGNNGQGVGGASALGSPIGSPDDILADLNNGSGMGSWCWPPRSNFIPQAAEITTHSDKGFILHRSRGGGGGGYWTEGARGDYFVVSREGVNSLNGLGQDMSNSDLIPIVNDALGVYEYNGRDDGSDKFSWDFGALVPNLVDDASGGKFIVTPGFESLDPDQGFLLGGSGGGGAGMGQHGSIADRSLGAG